MSLELCRRIVGDIAGRHSGDVWHRHFSFTGDTVALAIMETTTIRR